MHRKVSRGPTFTPTQDLTSGKPHAPASSLFSNVRKSVKQQRQLESLDVLMSGRLSSGNDCRFLQEFFWKEKTELLWLRHRCVPSLDNVRVPSQPRL